MYLSSSEVSKVSLNLSPSVCRIARHDVVGFAVPQRADDLIIPGLLYFVLTPQAFWFATKPNSKHSQVSIMADLAPWQDREPNNEDDDDDIDENVHLALCLLTT